MDRITVLPEGILPRILYFLSQKDVVRTSVLSKSWRYIWSTRPNLDFSEAIFKGKKEKFLSVVENTLQLYSDQKLCVEEFSLCLLLDALDQAFVSLLKKWIQILTNMGTKKFRLCTERHSPGLVCLPPVVFEAESLQDLHLEGFLLDQNAIERIVLCKKLKSLCLERVCIDDEIFEKIISNYPSIETIRVIRCLNLRTIKLNDLHHNLKSFSFEISCTYPKETCSIKIHPSSPVETFKIDEGNPRFHNGADFRSLKDLSLRDVKSSLDHLCSCKFPSLERLSLLFCDDGLKESQLLIHAPNILYFTYRGYCVPSISFATTSNKWKSDIYLHLYDAASSWFLKLNQLLKSLSQSKISLTILYHNERIVENIISLVQDINGYNKPVVVESLFFGCHLGSKTTSLLNGVFGICRPRKFDMNFNVGFDRTLYVGFMWQILMERENQDQADPFIQLLSRDLEAVSFEMKEKTKNEWHQATLSDFLVNYHHLQCRFALKWRGTLCES